MILIRHEYGLIVTDGLLDLNILQRTEQMPSQFMEKTISNPGRWPLDDFDGTIARPAVSWYRVEVLSLIEDLVELIQVRDGVQHVCCDPRPPRL